MSETTATTTYRYRKQITDLKMYIDFLESELDDDVSQLDYDSLILMLDDEIQITTGIIKKQGREKELYKFL